MNPQLNPATPTDARVDHILTALRTAEPPAGLEARIAARLAQARSQSTATPSFFASLFNAVKRPGIVPAPAQLYAATALALFAALTTFTLLHNHPATQSPSTPFRATRPARTTSPAQVAASDPLAPATSGRAATSNSANGPVPRGLSLGSHSSPEKIGGSTPALAQDPDQLALAETLAPSRPGPQLPLTTQEQTLVAATRPGQPIQLAELELARQPTLRAEAERSRNADIERYVKTLLAPFALADSLQPTKFSEPREISQALPAPLPTSSTN